MPCSEFRDVLSELATRFAKIGYQFRCGRPVRGLRTSAASQSEAVVQRFDATVRQSNVGVRRSGGYRRRGQEILWIGRSSHSCGARTILRSVWAEGRSNPVHRIKSCVPFMRRESHDCTALSGDAAVRWPAFTDCGKMHHGISVNVRPSKDSRPTVGLSPASRREAALNIHA
jgi:hypothetical protein